MSEGITVLTVGVDINIQRSDGRIHGATVTGLDTASGLVAVEWYEKGETKGKEIDIRAVLNLNKNVALTAPTSRSTVSRLQAQSKRQTHHSPAAHSSIPKGPSRLKNVENLIDGNSKVTQSDSHEELSKLAIPQVRAVDPNKPSVPRSKSAGIIAGKDSSKDNCRPHPMRPVDKALGPPMRSSREKDKERLGNGPAQSRKSNVVREVDMIKKKREERRVKNAEIKQERYKDYDPDNPNWEFLAMMRDYRSGIEIHPITTLDPVHDDRICVCLRKRPLSKKEISKKDIDIMTIPDGSLTMVHEPKFKVDLTKYLEHHKFNFDYAFDDSASNNMIYHYSAKPLVDTIFDQGMATCFAYGQTGSGKTHTMGGTFTGKEQDATKGIYALAAGDVFKLNRMTHSGKNLTVHASFFEIYCSKVFDLLNGKRKLRILEDAQGKVQVVGLQEKPVSSVADVLKLIETGNSLRTSGTTSANQNSSRSHAVFQIILRKNNNKLHGQLSLIDLAGNERGADTSSSDRQTRWEGAEINKSLLALKECIRALGKKSAHLPFRGSTLTQVLRDSFVGPKARTCMIATISPGLSCCEHTLNTLRYAVRVKDLPSKKRVRNNPAPSQVSLEPQPQEEEEEEEEEGEEQEEQNNLENSVDLQTFHEALIQLQRTEELIVEEHRDMLQASKEMLRKEEDLLTMVEGVDADPDEYIQTLLQMVDAKMDKLAAFKLRLEEYKERLREEEAASRRLHSLH